MSLNPECECIQMDLFGRSGMILYNIRPNLSTQTNEFTSTYWKLAEGQPAPLEGLWACATADTGGKGGGLCPGVGQPRGLFPGRPSPHAHSLCRQRYHSIQVLKVCVRHKVHCSKGNRNNPQGGNMMDMKLISNQI